MAEDTKQDLVRRTPRSFSLMPESLGEAREIANLIAASDFAPKDYKGKPGNVIIAIQMGADVGLKPMQALQNIAVINGRPSIWGDAAIALVQSADVLERFHETFTGTPFEDNYTAVCTLRRKGWPDEIVRTFSVADAKRAGLWMKKGYNGGDTPWVTYPQRMLQMRARGFALRDGAADRLMGLILAEEAMDYPADAIDVTPTRGELPPAQSLIDLVPEPLKESIEKAFVELKMAIAADEAAPWHPTGLGLTKLNEYLAGDGVDIGVAATALYEWCKDEYARRKTGQPRVTKGEGNGKKVANAAPSPAGSVGGSGASGVADPRGQEDRGHLDQPRSAEARPDGVRPQEPASSPSQAQVAIHADEIFKRPGDPLSDVGF